VIGLIEWNVITQLALLGLYWGYRDLLTALYVLHATFPAYFYFLVLGALAMGWIGWTALTALLGLRRLGRTVDRGRRARGYA